MIGLLSIFLISATISVIIVSQRRLPNDDLKLARESLSTAKEADANIYAEKLYNESLQMYDNAMRFW